MNRYEENTPMYKGLQRKNALTSMFVALALGATALVTSQTDKSWVAIPTSLAAAAFALKVPFLARNGGVRLRSPHKGGIRLQSPVHVVE